RSQPANRGLRIKPDYGTTVGALHAAPLYYLFHRHFSIPNDMQCKYIIPNDLDMVVLPRQQDKISRPKRLFPAVICQNSRMSLDSPHLEPPKVESAVIEEVSTTDLRNAVGLCTTNQL